ncbi:MAG TPA: hypothetical protein DDW17_06415 [Deltaproteobacteria bacterium]|nr:hypothetical protein [Deltaproteobacteria bacterium]
MHLHKRFSNDQVKVIFGNHLKGLISVKEALQLLEISRSQFFALQKEYVEDPERFSISYVRHAPKRIGKTAEVKIQKELIENHKLVQNPKIPLLPIIIQPSMTT